MGEIASHPGTEGVLIPSVTMSTMWTLCETTGSLRTMFGEIPGIAGEHLVEETLKREALRRNL